MAEVDADAVLKAASELVKRLESSERRAASESRYDVAGELAIAHQGLLEELQQAEAVLHKVDRLAAAKEYDDAAREL